MQTNNFLSKEICNWNLLISKPYISGHTMPIPSPKCFFVTPSNAVCVIPLFNSFTRNTGFGKSGNWFKVMFVSLFLLLTIITQLTYTGTDMWCKSTVFTPVRTMVTTHPDFCGTVPANVLKIPYSRTGFKFPSMSQPNELSLY